MVQIGSALSGFALCALFWWLPIWRMSQTESADGLFRYFVIVMMLVFGIFMVSSKGKGLSFFRTVPPLCAGAVASYGFSTGSWYVFGIGIAASWLLYVLGGE
jgi:hypothetical protein